MTKRIKCSYHSRLLTFVSELLEHRISADLCLTISLSSVSSISFNTYCLFIKQYKIQSFSFKTILLLELIAVSIQMAYIDGVPSRVNYI